MSGKKSPISERKRIAKRFKDFRERMLISQATLASLISIDRTAVIYIEQGKRFPHYTTLRKFTALESRGAGAKDLVKSFSRGKRNAKSY